MLVAIIAAAGVVIPSSVILAVVLMRETRRVHAFDRRLSISRTEALRLQPQGAADEAGRQGGRVFGELSVAAVRGLSLLVPIGAKERDKLARMLRTAGIQHREALAVYLCVKFVSAVAAGTAVSFAALGVDAIGQYPALIALAFLVGAVVGGLLPEVAIRSRSGSRSQQMTGALPNALDLLVMCLEAGLTFERALLTTAEELEAIEANLSRELRGLEAELRVGSDHRTVLQDFRHRTDVPGLQDLATTLLQSDRYGTPLTQAMRNIAESERLQRAARTEEKAQRLPVLMTLPMMLLVLPGTMLLMAGPAFLQALDALKTVG